MSAKQNEVGMKAAFNVFIFVILSQSLIAQAKVLEPGTYKQVRGNCCSVVKVHASNRNTLVVSASGKCGNILTTFKCDDGICTWDRETVAVRSSTVFELFTTYEDGELLTCKFQRK